MNPRRQPAYPFAGASLDRASRLRQDPAWLAQSLRDAGTLFVPVCDERCLVASLEAPRARFLSRWHLAEAGLDVDESNTVFLGLYQDRAVFALDVEAPSETLDGELVDLWQVGQRLDPGEAGILAYAKAMVGWRKRHRYCSLTGAPLKPGDGGHVLAGPDGHKLFPRVDPAIIVLVTHEQHCLLGRQATWPEKRYSTIAGFVEPGESLEEAVAREVHEETNIRVGEVQYRGSQPWPFPSSLMLGFHARAETTEIRLNDAELADACWFTRSDIAERRVLLPGRLSISYRLIESWFDSRGGPTLEYVLGGPVAGAER